METEYTYTCPNCSGECTVLESAAGQNVSCPHCSVEFFATSLELEAAPAVVQDTQQAFALPAKLPFFKSGRRKILEQRLEQLMAASEGTLDQAAEDELNKDAIAIGLDAKEGSKLIGEHFMREFDPIKRRMESSFVMTDEDVAEIKQLEKKYNARLTLEGNAELFRAIYLLETARKLPQPINTGLLLEPDEVTYYSIGTTWHQTRVHTHGYSGISLSVPTGIRGLRFRFGGYTPNKTEDITPLSGGTLFVTSKRLLFNGELRNTTISLNRIVDGHVYSDSVRIEKNTGKPDFFSMDAGQARYILSLIGALK